jgi:hypothetical protein
LSALAITALALAACASTEATLAQPFSVTVDSTAAALERPAPLGRAIDRLPPPVAVTQGGPSGSLLAGPGLPILPDHAVDSVIAPDLKNWLTFAERKILADASENAAVGETGIAIAWRAHDGADAPTASGTAVAVDDVYRSQTGYVCRDVRQSFAKAGDRRESTVALCRTNIAEGVTIWAVATAE